MYTRGRKHGFTFAVNSTVTGVTVNETSVACRKSFRTQSCGNNLQAYVKMIIFRVLRTHHVKVIIENPLIDIHCTARVLYG